jgi:hypothetical protein
MNKLQLYRLLRKNIKLSYRRSPAFEQNRWAKLLMGFGALMFIVYLIMYGVIIGMAADGEAGTLITAMLIILPIDFLLRFIFQTTPAMMVKPYILLPISRYSAIECFLISSHLSGFNFLWLGLFIPFAIIVLCAGAPVLTTLAVVLLAQLLIIINSQVYLFFRTLINRNVLWIIPALLFYAIPFIPSLITMSTKTLDHTLDIIQKYNTAWWLLPLALLVLCGLFMVNRHFQFKYVYEEISKQKEKQLRKVSQFAFFNRFGIIGEYLKIELKSNLRNKMMKQRCIMSLTLVVMFSILIAYTSTYDNPMMTNFWCLYCFSIYSMTVLIKIMGQEGNYISLLMTQRENILSLLKAKYCFFCAVLVIPFLIMLPAVFKGKFTLLMLFAYMLLVAGLIHFIIFQLAVYNKQSIPLQQKVTGKGNFENGIQIVIELAALLIPGIIVGLGYLTIGLTATYIFMCVLGLAFIVTYPWWIRNIYNRMMKRRYENIEGFLTTKV